jgi:uncharacterized protein (DUF1499 family)
MGAMELPDLKSLRSASTARTYPLEAHKLAHAIERAIQGLPRWTVTHTTKEEIRAVRRARIFGFKDDVTVRLTPSPVGAHTNTHAEFSSASRVALWDLGQNSRSLRELLESIDRELRAGS